MQMSLNSPIHFAIKLVKFNFKKNIFKKTADFSSFHRIYSVPKPMPIFKQNQKLLFGSFEDVQLKSR